MAGPIRIAILGDGGKAKKEFKETADAGEKAFDKLGKSVRVGISKSFGGVGVSARAGLGDLLGAVKGLPALAAGAALGGGLVAGFTKAMDLQDARGKLQAQLGLTGPQSAKAGKIAGSLYKQAYGDSVEDVNDVLKNLFQTGLAGIGDSQNKIEGISKAAFTLSKVMGEDTLPITRAVAQMLKTGLAKNAKEAFDVLTRGQQLGINKSEDLLDTFNEYGVQFKKLGLSATDALGLMNQLLQGGARDSDVAADAIKEFSIRAIDGSTSTVAGFKAIGLNAKTMAREIAAGGPTARTAFGEVLTAINSIKDPIKRDQAGVALFGTQWEDLGSAIRKADLGSAASSLGDLAGSTSRADDAMTTTRTKLTAMGRTIKFELVDAIAKYALPKLEEFTDWFAGPGKFVIADWGLVGLQGLLTFTEGVTRALGTLLVKVIEFGITGTEIFAKVYGKLPGYKGEFEESKRQIEAYRDKVKSSFTDAAESVHVWNDNVANFRDKVKITADIDDLDRKIAKATQELKDPNLTKVRKAQIEANIAQLERNRTAALRLLGDPKLIATRTAKLEADKKSLDAKIAAAQAELKSKELTKERRAILTADIRKLQSARRAAQADLNSLHGVTVPVTISVTAKINAAQIRNKVEQQLSRYGLEGRASGGSVLAGRTYLIGEQGPELLTLGGTSGYITPTQKLAPTLLGDALSSGGSGPVVINVYALSGGPEVGRNVIDAIRDYETFNGAGWRN